ncbi:antitoxin [Aeromicrobium sp.]|uniref:antitoxin n=1 Tax=Aeromicrobium sp. TaxID=1871063 RepID=UPI003C393ACE
MGFLDKLKKKAPELRDKAAGVAASHNDKIDGGIDKAADAISKATKGRFDDKIDGAANKTKDGVDKLAEDDK